MAGTAVEERKANLPAQRYEGADAEITAEDISLPRMKFAQGSSDVVLEGLVPYGSIYTTLGQGDADPHVIARAGKGEDGRSEAVLFYVVGLRKGYSWTDENNNLQRSRTAPEDVEFNRVSRTFDYVVVLPEVETELPFKFLMTGLWGGQAAKQLNHLLKKAAASGPSYDVPFELTAKKSKNAKGHFASAGVKRADRGARLVKKDLEVVHRLLAMVSARPDLTAEDTADRQVTDAPSLD